MITSFRVSGGNQKAQARNHKIQKQFATDFSLIRVSVFFILTWEPIILTKDILFRPSKTISPVDDTHFFFQVSKRFFLS
jgi:hypothetical protein